MIASNSLPTRMRVTLLGLLLVALSTITAPATAAPLACSAEYQVQQTFANGAAWDMCWERRSREGIVLRQIHYTTPAGQRIQVLASAAVAQIHVPYDDNGARYHDVSDYGLGTDSYLNNLQAADCPNGTRLLDGTRNVICRTLVDNQLRRLRGGNVTLGEALVLFSVSHVGAYNYIPEWRFYDDGTLEPAMGATGRLQRYTSNAVYGWPVRSGGSSYGVSHIHNYYWRLDFDLGDDGNNEVFEEIEFIDGATPASRTRVVTPYSTEVARSVAPQSQRFWRVRDEALTNADGAPISYDLIGVNTGHRDTGPSSEPWTYNDIYVTRSRDCERFTSRNPADGAGGCASNEDVTDFVNGENLAGEDLTVWYGLTFHHIPRDEDEAYMHAHWNHFQITPRDWTSSTPPPANTPPQITSIGAQTNSVGDGVDILVSASDADGDPLLFSATGLPTGLAIDTNTGRITGTTSAPGNFTATLAVADDRGGNASSNVDWTVNPAPNQAPVLDAPGNQSHAVGAVIDLQLTATDPDGDSLTFAIGGLPAGLSGSGSGRITGTATAEGSYNVTVSVQDPDGASDSGGFSWNVTPAPNNAPVLALIADQTNEVGASVGLQLSASDADGDALTYTTSGLPGGMSISAGGYISGTPGTSGNYQPSVTVADGNGGSDTRSFAWRINAAPPVCVGCVNFNSAGNVSYSNQDFTANSAIENGGYAMRLTGNTWRRTTQTFAINANTVVEFDFEAFEEGEIHGVGFDADDGLSSDRIFKVHGTQNWGITDFDNGYAGGVQTYRIPVGQFFTGGAMYLVIVNDKDSGSATNASRVSNIRVFDEVAANNPPVLTSPGAQSTLINTNVDLQLSALDADGDPLTYSATGLPSGLALNTATGRITGVANTTGSFNVDLGVTDGRGGSDGSSLTWTVAPQPNRAPVLNAPGAQLSDVGTSVNLTVSATDADGDTLSFSASGLPAGLTMATNGVISGTPTTPGTSSVTITVTDPSAATDQATFNWQIVAPPTGCSDCVNFNVSGNVSYSNQDAAANSSIVDDGLGLSLQANTWRRTQATFVITPDTVLEFEFESSSEGEIHGIGFDADDGLSSNRIFKVHGTQNWGITTYDNYGGGTVTYQIPVGSVYTGSAMHLVLVNDKDSGSGTNTSVFRNIRLLQGGANYAPTIDNPGNQSTPLGSSVDLQIQASDLNGDPLTFGASGLPAGLAISAGGRITGTPQTVGISTVLVTASDTGNESDEVTFSWTITDGCNDCVDFDSTTTVSYSNQDVARNWQVQDAGASLALADNTWRRTERTYTITANTVVEFEFSSDNDTPMNPESSNENLESIVPIELQEGKTNPPSSNSSGNETPDTSSTSGDQ